jgi:hypothetical protein
MSYYVYECKDNCQANYETALMWVEKAEQLKDKILESLELKKD